MSSRSRSRSRSRRRSHRKSSRSRSRRSRKSRSRRRSHSRKRDHSPPRARRRIDLSFTPESPPPTTPALVTPAQVTALLQQLISTAAATPNSAAPQQPRAPATLHAQQMLKGKLPQDLKFRCVSYTYVNFCFDGISQS